MRGILHSVEAFIAIVLLAVVAMSLFSWKISSPELSQVNYKLSAFNGLDLLESTELRGYTLNNNATAIENKLSSFIPYFLSYRVTIYNRTTNTTAIPSIDASDVITVSYFLAGDIGNYTPREVRVYIWGFD